MTYKCSSAEPFVPPGKSPMSTMTYGFLLELITAPSLNAVEGLSLPHPTSKATCFSLKLLELLALHQWQLVLSSLMQMEYLMYDLLHLPFSFILTKLYHILSLLFQKKPVLCYCKMSGQNLASTVMILPCRMVLILKKGKIND